jgi:hypothetical protein
MGELMSAVVYKLGWPVGRLLHKVDVWLRTLQARLFWGVTGGYTSDD